MHEIMLAVQADVPHLLALYCKALRAAAMDTVICSEEKRDDFVKWLTDRCKSQCFQETVYGGLTRKTIDRLEALAESEQVTQRKSDPGRLANFDVNF